MRCGQDCGNSGPEAERRHEQLLENDRQFRLLEGRLLWERGRLLWERKNTAAPLLGESKGAVAALLGESKSGTSSAAASPLRTAATPGDSASAAKAGASPLHFAEGGVEARAASPAAAWGHATSAPPAATHGEPNPQTQWSVRCACNSP